MNENSTSHVFISEDYGSTFTDISSKFLLKKDEETQATINKFFHHPHDNCYYVFTDTGHRHIFVTRDCGQTVDTHAVTFHPAHVEFDTQELGRFLVHDRESDQMELYVTENYGESFSKAADYVKTFFWHYEEVRNQRGPKTKSSEINLIHLILQNFTELYISRMEPSGKLNILSSRSFFQDHKDTTIVFTGALEFEKKENYLFIVKENKNNPEQKRFFLAKTDQMQSFVEAKFSTNLELKDFHVAEVSFI